MITKQEFLQALGRNCLPQRYLLTFMLFISATILVMNHIHTRTAIDYVTRTPWTSKCSNITKIKSDMEVCWGGYLEWDVEAQQYVVNVFVFGFLFGLFPAYYINKKIGSKYCQGLSTLLSSLLSILSVPAFCNSFDAAVVTRFLQGFVSGPAIASFGDLMSEWAPPSERTLLTVTVYSGVQVAMVVSVGIGDYILKVMPWSGVFYISGALGIVWFIFWTFLCYHKPSEHPFITESELQYLKKVLPEIDRSMPTPWKDILKSKSIWIIIIADMGLDCATYIIVDAPDFLCDVTSELNETQISIMTSIPYLFMMTASILAGYSCDKLIEIKSSRATRTKLRRLLGSIGCVFPGIGMVAASYLYNVEVMSTVIAISVIFLTSFVCSIRVNPMDLSRNHVSAILPLVTIAGTTSRLIAPKVANAIIASGSREALKNLFWTVFAILAISNLPFAVYGSGDIQPWDKPKIQPVIRIVIEDAPSAPANQSKKNISVIILNNNPSTEAS